MCFKISAPPLTNTAGIIFPDWPRTSGPSRTCFRDGSSGSISGWILNPDLGLVFVSSLAGILSWTFATSSGFHSSVTFQILRSPVKCHSTKKQEWSKTRTAKKFVDGPGSVVVAVSAACWVQFNSYQYQVKSTYEQVQLSLA